jgi:hypothetical protein
MCHSLKFTIMNSIIQMENYFYLLKITHKQRKNITTNLMKQVLIKSKIKLSQQKLVKHFLNKIMDNLNSRQLLKTYLLIKGL